MIENNDAILLSRIEHTHLMKLIPLLWKLSLSSCLHQHQAIAAQALSHIGPLFLELTGLFPGVQGTLEAGSTGSVLESGDSGDQGGPALSSVGMLVLSTQVPAFFNHRDCVGC